MAVRESATRAARTKRVETARERLRAAGLRVTLPRLTVLDALARLARPVSHAELAAELAAGGLDRVTVWRNLVALHEAGLVARSDPGDRTYRFELRRVDGAAAGATAAAHGADAHPHFVCTACGTVRCLDVAAVQLDALAQAAGAVSAIELKGRCVACA